MRDMSWKQYKAALERHGFKPQLLGYIKINDRLSVHPANAGIRLRDRLAYLLKAEQKYKEGQYK